MSRFQLIVLWVLLFVTQALGIFTDIPENEIHTSYLLIIVLAVLGSVKIRD